MVTMLEVREARSPFGRLCKRLFWLFQALCLLAMLGTCAFVQPYLGNPDPDVALGAGLFGAMAIGTLWLVWPAGTVVLAIMVLATRGARRLIPAPAAFPPPARLPETGPGPRS